MLLEAYDIEKVSDEDHSYPSFNIEKYYLYIKNYIINSMSNNDSSLYIYNSISPYAVLQFYIMANYLNLSKTSNISNRESKIIIIESNKDKTKKGQISSDVYWKSLLTYDIFVTITNLEDSLDISIINENTMNKVYIYISLYIIK